MKSLLFKPTLVALLCIYVVAEAFAQGTSFTYQGRLSDGAQPANGLYDLRFTVYGDPGGEPVVPGGEPVVTTNGVPVTNGLFMLKLDFGPGRFDGSPRWLQIAVRTNGVAGEFTILNPLQAITATPYALYSTSADTARMADSAGTVPWSGVSGLPEDFADWVDNDTLYTAGAGLNLNGSTFSLNSAFTDDRYWKLGGNSGTAAGVQFLGTTDDQSLELVVNGARILRLEPHSFSPNLIGGYSGNSVTAGMMGGTIGGGGVNGSINRVSGNYSTVGGGTGNTIGSAFASIGGGSRNAIQDLAASSVIGGGDNNIIQGGALAATISGGFFNAVESDSKFSAIGGGDANTIQASTEAGTIAGGLDNEIHSGGLGSTICGGRFNRIETESQLATIGGGGANVIQGDSSQATIGGGYQNTIQTNTSHATIAGGDSNTIRTNADFSTVGGGRANLILTEAAYTTVAGGYENSIRALYGTVGGGWRNAGAGDASVIGGGRFNSIHTTAHYATVGGGWDNTAGGEKATVSGGWQNYAAGYASTIGGGWANQTVNDYSTVPGGMDNQASGPYSLAAGRKARALHEGAFVWADSHDTHFSSTLSNQFLIRADRVGIGTNAPEAKLDVVQTSDEVAAFKANHTGSGNYLLAGSNWYGAYASGNQYDFVAGGPGVDYGSSSSIRWKRKVRPIKEPLEKLDCLRGVHFDWDAAHGGRHDIGMIAEEVGTVLPEIVAYEANGADAVAMDYSKLTPLLVEAVKALNSQIKARQTQIEPRLRQQDALIDILRQQNQELVHQARLVQRRLETLEVLANGPQAVKTRRTDDAHEESQK